MPTIRDLIPAKYRQIIYTLFATFLAVAAVVPIVDDGALAKIVKIAAALGFTLAAGNTRGHDPLKDDEVAEPVDDQPADEAYAEPAYAPAPVAPEFAPGLYEAFPSRRRADLYALAAWVLALHEAAAANNGALVNTITGQSEAINLPTRFDQIMLDLRRMTNDQVAYVQARLDGFELPDGDTVRTRWPAPRLGADGAWHVLRIPGDG